MKATELIRKRAIKLLLSNEVIAAIEARRQEHAMIHERFEPGVFDRTFTNILDATTAGTFPRLAAPDQPLDSLDLLTVDLPRLFVPQEFVDMRFELIKPLGADLEFAAKILDKLGVAKRVFIEHGDVARSLIGDMNFMSLIDQTDQSPAHRDHVVVRMG